MFNFALSFISFFVFVFPKMSALLFDLCCLYFVLCCVRLREQKNEKCVKSRNRNKKTGSEAGFLVRVHPEPCLILSRAQIRALLC
jgi:hypothetical protein